MDEIKYDLLQTVANGGSISNEAATANDTREQIVAIIYMAAFIISIVTFILWFRRAYYNLHIKLDHLSLSEGWAAGSWFVPIVNLFRPFQIMKELYQETENLLIQERTVIDENFTTRYLGWWWALWIINSAIGQFVFRYTMKAESIDELTISTISTMVQNIVGIPLALITIKVIRDYANIEPQLNEIDLNAFCGNVENVEG
jgi:hypothetical protein